MKVKLRDLKRQNQSLALDVKHESCMKEGMPKLS